MRAPREDYNRLGFFAVDYRAMMMMERMSQKKIDRLWDRIGSN